MPGSARTVTVSVRTLERFLAQYRQGGLDALYPKPRQDKGRMKLPSTIVERAVALRREQPARSVEQIILLLEDEGIAAKGQVAASTLARHLRRAGVRRQDLLAVQTDTFRRFEARHPHELWQSDAQHTLYLPDPVRPGHRRKAILFAIVNDYSRLLVHAQFYWDEKLPRLEDCFKKAILKHGIPERFYCDNGAVFSTHHLARICGRLGIHLSHSRPGRPQGRGVDASLARRRVTLRYDPFDMTVVQVHSGGTRYADAAVVDLARRRDRRAPAADPVSPSAPDPVSFLAAAQRTRQAKFLPVTYAGPPDGERS